MKFLNINNKLFYKELDFILKKDRIIVLQK